MNYVDSPTEAEIDGFGTKVSTWLEKYLNSHVPGHLKKIKYYSLHASSSVPCTKHAEDTQKHQTILWTAN